MVKVGGNSLDGTVQRVVSQAIDVIKHPSYLLEVHHADVVWKTRRQGVEAVGVRWNSVCCPACHHGAAVRGHYYVAKVGSAATVLGGVAIRSRVDEVAWDLLRTGHIVFSAHLWVRIEDPLRELRANIRLSSVAGHVGDEDSSAIDTLGSESHAFISVGAVDDGHMHKAAIGELLGSVAGDEVAVDDGQEAGAVGGRVEDGVDLGVRDCAQALQGVDCIVTAGGINEVVV